MRTGDFYRLILKGNRRLSAEYRKVAETLMGIFENADRTLGGLDTMARHVTLKDGTRIDVWSHGNNDRQITITTPTVGESQDECIISMDSGIFPAYVTFIADETVDICPQQAGVGFLDTLLRQVKVERYFGAVEQYRFLVDRIEEPECGKAEIAFNPQLSTANATKRAAIYFCPPSLFTGKLRRTVSAWYGASTEALTWSVTSNEFGVVQGAAIAFDDAGLGSGYFRLFRRQGLGWKGL